MFPLPMLATIPDDLDSIDSRFAFRYHLAFMKNTISRAMNNIHTHALELRCDDPRLTAFFEYIGGFCDVLMLHIRADERLFHSPIFAGVALVKLSGEGCVQDMRRVFRGAEKLKELAQKYASNPKHYDGEKIIARLSFGREFSARSWAQIHSIDVERLQSTCQESEMRQGIHKIIASFSQHQNDFLIPFIYSHHDKETSSQNAFQIVGASAIRSIYRETSEISGEPSLLRNVRPSFQRGCQPILPYLQVHDVSRGELIALVFA